MGELDALGLGAFELCACGFKFLSDRLAISFDLRFFFGQFGLVGFNARFGYGEFGGFGGFGF